MKKVLKIFLILIVFLLIGILIMYLSVDYSPDYLKDKLIQKNYPEVSAFQEANPLSQKKFEPYTSRANARMPKEHLDILEQGENLSSDLVLPRNEVNRLLDDGYLESESGYRLNEDGSSYISVLTKMPGVTLDMIDWWFWWHAKEGVRYQIWYPDMHYNITSDFKGLYDDSSLSYRDRLHHSVHLVKEDIGLGVDDIYIDFMSPEAFGFDPDRLHDNVTIICARAGTAETWTLATDMCHFVRATEDGVEMRSRFWFGQKIRRIDGFGQTFINTILNQSFVKRKLLPPNVGEALFHHCSQEFHNLAAVLPQIYLEEGPKD